MQTPARQKQSRRPPHPDPTARVRHHNACRHLLVFPLLGSFLSLLPAGPAVPRKDAAAANAVVRGAAERARRLPAFVPPTGSPQTYQGSVFYLKGASKGGYARTYVLPVVVLCLFLGGTRLHQVVGGLASWEASFVWGVGSAMWGARGRSSWRGLWCPKRGRQATRSGWFMEGQSRWARTSPRAGLGLGTPSSPASYGGPLLCQCALLGARRPAREGGSLKAWDVLCRCGTQGSPHCSGLGPRQAAAPSAEGAREATGRATGQRHAQSPMCRGGSLYRRRGPAGRRAQAMGRTTGQHDGCFCGGKTAARNGCAPLRGVRPRSGGCGQAHTRKGSGQAHSAAATAAEWEGARKRGRTDPKHGPPCAVPRTRAASV
jgi:hypothetical protein